MAIYYYLLYRKTGEKSYLAQAQALFEAKVAAIAEPAAALEPAARGLAGLAWLHAHLPGASRTESLLRLDERLFHRARLLVETHKIENSPELWRILHYFTKRLPTNGTCGCLHDLIELLYQKTSSAELTAVNGAGTGSTLILPLGVAGSLTSEIALLAEVGVAGIQRKLVQRQAQQKVATLLATKSDVDFSAGRYSVFPVTVDKTGKEPMFSNYLNWLRGADLGASLALYKAQLLLGDTELGNIAELVGLNTLLRTEPVSTQIKGAQFCRGAFGVAYAYARLYMLSQHPAYQRSYHYWLERAEQWLHAELAAGYYRQRRVDSLGGALGVGLMLLFAAAPAELALLHAEAIEVSQS